MGARAIWKGIVVIDKLRLPVKLYSAVDEHTVHFRLLHAADHSPVHQKMVDSETGEEVDRSHIHKAWPAGRRRLVMLDETEIESIEPKPSRDIHITRFVKPEAIDHRWYERSYYLGPDGDAADCFAAAEALRKAGREGVAWWVMRKKEYVGSLREDHGYLVLIALRHAEEVIDADALPRPEGRPLQKREIAMADQLIHALAGTFDPTQFRDDYHDRVMELIERKARGGKAKVVKHRPKKTREGALANALEASLAGMRRKRVA